MQPDLSPRSALVFGGTGAVGRAVLRELAQRGVATTFTYFRAEAAARDLAAEHGASALRVDLGDAAATTALFAELEARSVCPDVFIHCAATSRLAALGEVSLATFQHTLAVNTQSAFLACQWLSGRMRPDSDIVLLGALDRVQSLPLPVHFAATQGALSAMVMALAHELGPRGIRVNLIALGVLEGGLTRELDAKRLKDYEHFSALRRVGTAAEAARAIAWLALENRYISGKVLPINGGI